MRARPITISEVTSFSVSDIVRVPLPRNLEALIDFDDYQELISLGLSKNWTINNGCVVASRIADGPKREYLYVARVLLDAKKGEVVRHRDGDRLNLRRENLYLKDGYSINADRQLLIG